MTVIEMLHNKQDLEYKKFHSKLIPNIPEERIIGVRIPEIRKIAKSLKGTEEADAFLKNLPHKFYEENNLHVFFICEIPDFDSCVFELNRFLPYVDNWATCDSIRPKCFNKEKDRLLTEIKIWLQSKQTFTVRFAIEMLMVHFLDEHFSTDTHSLVLSVKSDEYYIKMMVAWYFATALAKQWNSTIGVLENKTLPIWIHNKTIQKAIESYRITKEQKNYLRTLKIKTTV